MIGVNSNRSVNFLFISIILIVSGCSETPTSPITTSYQAPVTVAQEDTSSPRYHHKHHHKTALAYKNTVWERLLSLYSLPEIDNIRVERELNWYLDHPAYIARVQQRAEPYLHFILDEIEAKNIPGELALLPIVESAFVPDAYSKADASGLWQFIPATGRLYGLKQDEWYDGRRDIYASTKAATSFLKHLGETFNGDWFLALASYNCGKGNIWKSMERNEERNLPTDYWSLDLPKETEDYVPRLLAIAKLIANAEEYNIPLQRIPDEPYLEVVDIESPLDLQKAAQLADMPLSKFLKLNPGFNRLCTAPKGPHRLLVPVKKAESFKLNLAQLPFEERVDFSQYLNVKEEPEENIEEERIVQTPRPREVSTNRSGKYKVKSGENLLAIANRNHTTLQSIHQANHLTSNSVRPDLPMRTASTKKSPDARTLTQTSKNSYLVAHSTLTNSKITKKAVVQIASHNPEKFTISNKNASKWTKVPAKPVIVAGHKTIPKSGNQQLASSSAGNLAAFHASKRDLSTQSSRKLYVPAPDLRKSNTGTLSKKGQRSGGKFKVVLNSHHSI